MGLSRARVLLLGLYVVFVVVCTFHITVCTKRTKTKKLERLSPPLDIQLQTVNCTAIKVHWRMPRRHVNTISGYKVFYTEMRNSRPVNPTVTLDVPLNHDTLIRQFDGQAGFDVVVGKLKASTQYEVSVGTYGWAEEGQPSTPRNISTGSHEICMPPSPPTQPLVVAVSDTELALSWQQRKSEGTAPVLYFLVAYIRPEMDTEWTYIREPVESNSMVLKGLIPETEYQFVVRSVNVHGISPPSPINNPVQTLSPSDEGSGDSDIYITKFKDKYGFDIDDSDYDIIIEELKPFPGVNTNTRRSQLRAHTGSPENTDVIYRTPATKNTSASQSSSFTSAITIWTTAGPKTDIMASATSTPTSISITAASTASSTHNISTPTAATHSNSPIPTTTTTTIDAHRTRPIQTTTTTTTIVNHSKNSIPITTSATHSNILVPTTTTPNTSTPRTSPIPTTTTPNTSTPRTSPIPTTTTPNTSTPRTSPIPTTTTPNTSTPRTSPIPTRSALPVPSTSPSSSVTIWKGAELRVYNVSCGETVCPQDSFCTDRYAGGSRCHCNLGHQGEHCAEGLTIQFPRFYGYSHMTFEPLKNSYQRFHISMEFKADSKDGLLLYCGENEHGRGDFTSLALIGGKLHYRFNCGTGAAQIVSKSSIVIGRWHIISIFRDGFNGWLRLDNDTPVSGYSQGQYTKITFRTPLYVGGAPTAYRLVRTVGTSHGFQGCVQSLSINSKSTDLRPWPRGNALNGADIVCLPTRADRYICLCPLGYRGDHCEESFVMSLPRFNESLYSYISAPWPQGSHSYLSFMEFDVTFYPAGPDGTLLYSYDAASTDFLSIILVGGYVEVRFDCGSGVAVIRSEKVVRMNTWHDLRVSRTAKNGILQVDDQPPVEGRAEGAFTQIKCSSPLYIGGVPDYDITKSNAGVIRAFSGAIQKITLNDNAVAMTTGQALGVNVQNALHPCVENPCANGGTCRPLKDDYDCDCILGFDGRHCQKECGNYCLNTVTEAIEIPQFTGRSYLIFDKPHILKRVSGSRTNLFIRFKSTSKDGMLLWRGESPARVNSDYLSLGLQNGALIFSYNLGSGAAIVEVNGTFSDGKWHRVKAVREGQFGKLTVDDYGSTTGRSAGKMRQLNISGDLYVGGMKEIALHTSRRFLGGLVGCISHVTLSTDYHVALVEDAADGKNINTCTN
ncbi:pikachurin isoform X2 [Brachyhypopomus gauderio]|uniref:pikachurin isoform X2 n=1 Tax=Brachyhypopomus gauderio TaxID=698409 RepID=UPI00404199B3